MTTIKMVLDEQAGSVKETLARQQELDDLERFYDSYNEAVNSHSLSNGDIKSFLNWTINIVGRYYGIVKGTHELL